MYNYIKKILFLMNPETAHNLANTSLSISSNLPFMLNILSSLHKFHAQELEQQLFGKIFKNPIGLAGGFDKDATSLNALNALGFGHIEYGTLTLKPQSGNEKPRLFRFIKDNSLQNAMGFNNKGLQEILKNLQKVKTDICPLGASIGKNKNTPNEKALDEYLTLIENLDRFCDYFAINISSPNTKGLRNLQNEEFLSEILSSSKIKTEKPIFIKLSPDMSVDSALSLCEVAYKNGAKGIIATNTSVDYSLLNGAKNFGGISGEALKIKSREFFKFIAKDFFDKLTLISVGGISSGKEAYERVKLGASLIQIYTGFIFKGSRVVKNMNEDLLTLLKKDGFKNIHEAIGSHWN